MATNLPHHPNIGVMGLNVVLHKSLICQADHDFAVTIYKILVLKKRQQHHATTPPIKPPYQLP
jgi:hypothetical protein